MVGERQGYCDFNDAANLLVTYVVQASLRYNSIKYVLRCHQYCYSPGLDAYAGLVAYFRSQFVA